MLGQILSFHANELDWPLTITKINLQKYVIKNLSRKEANACGLQHGHILLITSRLCQWPFAMLLQVYSCCWLANSIHSCPDESNVQLAFLAQ